MEKIFFLLQLSCSVSFFKFLQSTCLRYFLCSCSSGSSCSSQSSCSRFFWSFCFSCSPYFPCSSCFPCSYYSPRFFLYLLIIQFCLFLLRVVPSYNIDNFKVFPLLVHTYSIQWWFSVYSPFHLTLVLISSLIIRSLNVLSPDSS